MTSRASRPWKGDLVEIALIFAVFFVQGAWPVPDVNEPNYLGKAISYWNPDWVPGDFFLESADAHWVFYFAFGWLGLLVSPPVMAWVGRVLTWGLLAWSWQRLSRAMVPRRGMAVLSGALFACLMERCHMAGEWVIGGVEAKGFAYVLVFLGLEAMVRGRWNRAWLLFGGASLVHVVVGAWVVLAAGFAWLVQGPQRPTLRSMWPGLIGGFLISLPALIPLLALNSGVDAATAARAHEIYQSYRLPHHLILHQFKPHFLARFAGLVAVWALLCMAVDRRPRQGKGEDEGPLRSLVFWALAITLIGAMLNLPVFVELVDAIVHYAIDAINFCLRVFCERVLNLRLFFQLDQPGSAKWLLRFYWFRLTDVAVPMGVALFAVVWIHRLLENGVRWRAATAWLVLAGGVAVALWNVGDFTYLRIHLASGLRPAIPRADLKVDKVGGYDAWCDACDWIATRSTIPKDARFLTPIDGSTFKWRAGRPEVVTRKEIPQDAASIVQWWNRLRDIHGIGPDEPTRYWYWSLAELGEDRLRELGRDYHADYLLTEAPGVELPETEARPEKFVVPQLALPCLYSNGGYAVYQLRRGP